ncbi:MAG: DUF1573 domain-containing protein [Saprospirales bacterium]|nr:MAG: DUF1573 domain-containing protein [Saprospirales bacterium]
MNTNYLFLLLALPLLLTLIACQNDSDRAVQSVVNPDLDQLIRNPISLRGDIDSSQLPIITFEREIIYFDTVSTGAIVEKFFSFTNTGTAPLWLSNARSTCGCTVPDFPRDPILPGEGGEIKVRLNTADRDGYQDRPVTIYANTIPGRTVVRLRGFVLPDEPES